MEYTKTALDIPAIIALLQSRGLAITDTKAAESFLRHVSYFRFAAYMKPLEADHDSHRFKPSATFEQAFALYNFDAELRKLVFDAIVTRGQVPVTPSASATSLEYGGQKANRVTSIWRWRGR